MTALLGFLGGVFGLARLVARLSDDGAWREGRR